MPTWKVFFFCFRPLESKMAMFYFWFPWGFKVARLSFALPCPHWYLQAGETKKMHCAEYDDSQASLPSLIKGGSFKAFALQFLLLRVSPGPIRRARLRLRSFSPQGAPL